MPPRIASIDHIHVHVRDRAAAELWYRDMLGLARVEPLAFWAADGGPLTIGNPDGSVHLALFERPVERCRSTVAFGVDAVAFRQWQVHLQTTLRRDVEAIDHGVSWSLYFTDPDANPFEITTYDHAEVALGGAGLKS